MCGGAGKKRIPAGVMCAAHPNKQALSCRPNPGVLLGGMSGDISLCVVIFLKKIFNAFACDKEISPRAHRHSTDRLVEMTGARVSKGAARRMLKLNQAHRRAAMK